MEINHGINYNYLILHHQIRKLKLFNKKYNYQIIQAIFKAKKKL